MSPLGPIADVMWAGPDGRRRLLAPSQEVAAFVSAVYRFDDVVVTPLSATVHGRTLVVVAPLLDLSLQLRAGRGWPVPPVPAWVTRYLGGPLAWRLLRVRTYGTTPTGVREWYRARWYRPLVEGRAWLEGRDLGSLRPLDPPVRFGFSEPPRRPSMVWVRPLLGDPTGRLARALGQAA
ncbi:MAG: hypothetical protein M3314_09780 [Actinomycetota bacterium]|nr:hypothetical protein [Actinomycetota bacterium]